MKLYVTIDFDEPQNFSYTIDTDFLYLTFNNFESYALFLQNPLTITMDDAYYKSIFDKKEFSKMKKVQCYFNTHMADLFSKTQVQIQNIKPEHIGSLYLLKNPSLVDLRPLSFKELWSVLNAPWPDNSLFMDRFNEIEAISQSRLLNTYQTVQAMLLPLQNMSFSPVEVLMLAYDICRNRVYKKNQDSFNKARSRDLCQVLENEEIVCAGYVHLFMCISYILGVSTEIVVWKNNIENKDGHATCIAYVNDEKYNIHSLLCFDPTVNRKKSTDDVEYINNCSKAFIPINEHNESYQKTMSIYYAGLYSLLKRRFQQYQENMQFDIPDFLMQQSKMLVVHTLNDIYYLLGIDPVDVSISYEDLQNQIMALESNSNAIDVEVFDQIVRVVRTSLHSLDETYPIDEHSLSLTVASSSSMRHIKTNDFRKVLRILFSAE